VFAAQVVQVLEAAAPVAVEYVPAAQAEQAVDADIDEYVPAAQSAQLEELIAPVLPLNWPVEHC